MGPACSQDDAYYLIEPQMVVKVDRWRLGTSMFQLIVVIWAGIAWCRQLSPFAWKEAWKEIRTIEL
jgi:hypothetical protein